MTRGEEESRVDEEGQALEGGKEKRMVSKIKTQTTKETYLKRAIRR